MIKIIFTVLMTIAVLAGVFIGSAPLHQAKLVTSELDTLIDMDQKFYDDFEYQKLTRKVTFKRSLLDASNIDKINLVIDMGDSTVQLHIKGVTIHSTKLSGVRIDRWLSEMPTAYYNHTYGQPMSITQERTTIVKEPIVVREAPSNPKEAEVNAYQPDTLIQNPAFVEFELNQNLLLVFEQNSDMNDNDTKVRKGFGRDRMYRNLHKKLSSLSNLEIPAYQPQIKMSLSARDLRAIYRALPSDPVIILYLPVPNQ